MNVDSSGGAITSTTAGSAGAAQSDGAVSSAETTSEPTTAEKRQPKTGGKSGSDYSASSAHKSPTRLSVTTETPVGDETEVGSSKRRVAAVQDSVGQLSGPSEAHVPVQLSMAPTALTDGAASDQAVQALASAPAASNSAVSGWKLTVLSAMGLAPLADGDVPGPSGDSPLALVGWAALRRQTQQGLVEDETMTKTASDPSQSSLMMAAAVVNSAPTATPVVGSPDQNTGAVLVSLNAIDADGNPLSYTVTGQPTGGSVEALSGGQFRYTPTVASRLAAASTSTPDFDSFTVSVSDGQGGVTPVTVSVPKLPAVWANQASSSNVTGASPYGVALVGDLAYVANQGTNTVTVVNTKTGAVVGSPIVVGRAPTGVLANADGSRVYVTNRTDGTVSVIRTSDNVVIGSVKVGTSPEFMALNDTGTRLYVTNYGSSTVSVIDTATNKLVDTNPSTTTVDAIKVGAYPRGIAFTTVNGQPRLYVVNRSGNSVSVIDANTYKLIDANPSTTTVDSIKVGSTPEMITIRDGYAYVTNTGSNTVSVINTATNKVEGSAITVGSKPAGVAFSTDGSVLYVANGNDTVSVIDAKTRTVVNTVQIDTAPESNYHIVAVRSDGALVVTDMSDKAVRMMTLKRGNTAPVSIANPTVGAPDPATGAVSGAVAVKDWDGDTVTYSVPTQPSTGTVTVSPAGTWTFTPSAAARQQASQTPGMTASFTIVASDGLGGTTSVPVSNVPILYSGNRPPVAYAPASVGTPDAITGVIGLNVNVTDPDGDPLTYTVTTPPTNGTAEQWAPTLYPYLFKYTPTQAARDLALQTPGPDTDTFIVTVSDGTTSIPYTVTVPIQPANRAPVASPTGPTVGAPNVANGTVSGTLNVTDPDGNPLNYTVISSPASGGVTVGYNGSFAYTPTQDAREAAAGSGAKTDTFTVRVTDTQYSVDVPVTVPISPTSDAVSTSAVTVGSGASGVVVSGNGAGVINPNRAYVVNTVSNSVSVVDTTTNTVTDTIAVGPSPLSLAITPDGSRVYVTNSADNTVSVINTTSKTVVATIQVPVQSTWNPEVGEIPNVVGDIVVSPTGDRAYVTATDGTVSVINTSTNTVVSSNSVGYYSDLKISPDGKHLYGTSFGYYGSPSVAVLDISPAGTVTYNSAITVGPVWDLDAMQSEFTDDTYNVVLSPDGRRMYVTYGATTVARGTGGHTSGMFISDSRGQNWLVTGGYTAVSVIDIDPVTGRGTEVSRIAVPAGAQDVALSPDGHTLYVTSWDGLSVTMIDTASNAVTGGFTTDVSRTTTPPRDLTWYGGERYFNRFVVVGPDGTVYVTDYDDGKLYATAVGSTAL